VVEKTYLGVELMKLANGSSVAVGQYDAHSLIGHSSQEYRVLGGKLFHHGLPHVLIEVLLPFIRRFHHPIECDKQTCNDFSHDEYSLDFDLFRDILKASIVSHNMVEENFSDLAFFPSELPFPAKRIALAGCSEVCEVYESEHSRALTHISLF